MSIHGKVALITGAGQGIGRGIALRLASDGADIAIVDMNEGKMQGVADEVRALGRKATTFKADVTDRNQVYAAIDHAENELGGFDIMVNNAGIANVQAVADLMPDEVEKILKVNVEAFCGASRPLPPSSRRAGTRAKSSMRPQLPGTTVSPC